MTIISQRDHRAPLHSMIQSMPGHRATHHTDVRLGLGRVWRVMIISFKTQKDEIWRELTKLGCCDCGCERRTYAAGQTLCMWQYAVSCYMYVRPCMSFVSIVRSPVPSQAPYGGWFSLLVCEPSA